MFVCACVHVCVCCSTCALTGLGVFGVFGLLLLLESWWDLSVVARGLACSGLDRLRGGEGRGGDEAMPVVMTKNAVVTDLLDLLS